MAAVRIGPKHRVTIPQKVFRHLHLSAGDFVEAEAEGGRIVLTPLRLAAKTPATRLTPTELWMNLQMTWDLRRAEMRRKAS